MGKVQKIKEEIEKKRQLIWPKNTGEMKVVDTPKQLIQGWLNCLKWIEDFIDSLPEESGCEVNFTTKSEDLEEEWKRYIDSKGGGTITINVKDIAHHFAEWQREKDIKLEKIDDLEKFAQKWAYSNYHKELDGVNCDCLYSGVIKGAEWQKQQMKEALQTEYEEGRFDMREEIMKEAVEADVIVDRIGEVVYLCPHTSEKTGDKVKIIIVKTEQQ